MNRMTVVMTAVFALVAIGSAMLLRRLDGHAARHATRGRAVENWEDEGGALASGPAAAPPPPNHRKSD